MQVIILLATVSFVFTAVLAAYIFYKNPKDNINRLYAVFSIPVGIWYFGFIFMVSAPDEAAAHSWFRFMASGWAILMPFFLHLILVLTKNRPFDRHRWLYVPIYLPALFMTYVNVEMKTVGGFFLTSLGWAYVYKKNSLWTIGNMGFVVIYVLTIFIVLSVFERRTADSLQKKQCRVMLWTIAASLCAFLLVTYLPVIFDTQPLSYLDLLTVQIWEIGLSYAIIRYGFMVVSPQSAASSILSTMADGLILTDPDGYVVGANAALYELLRQNEESILHKRIESLLPGAFLHRDLRTLLASENVIRDMEAVVSSSDGTDIHVSISASVVSDRFGRKTGCVTLLRDISERKRTERQLQHMATHDVLTNLPNRAMLNDRLRNALVRAKRYRQLVGILFIDVDNFKNINDMFGHDIGDIVLKEVADALSAGVRECDTVTRIGGDEFVIILTDLDNQSGCEIVVERIRAAFHRPLTVGHRDISVTLSIGGSIYPHHAENVEDLYKCADLALYRVKESGRNGCQFYSLEIDAAARKNMKLEQEMHSAIEEKQFELYYQPMYATDTGRLMSMEALLRWIHPELGLIHPMDFIPIAERSGLIIPIGEWALAKACRQQREWRKMGLTSVPITVNVSARQFQDPELVSKIEQALRDSDVPPSYLELELTESTAMIEIKRTIATVRRLKEKGISIIIDNFGSGYSSMAWLKQLDVRAIKIDRFFIQNIAHDLHDAAIVKAIISMAHSMGIQVVAEGIETQEQLEALRSMRWDVSTELACDVVQGYLFSKPVTSDTATTLLSRSA